MKYTKTAAALTLAGIAASPLAQAQTTVTLSGQVAIGILGSDAEDIDAVNEGDPLDTIDPATGLPEIAGPDDVVSAASPGDLILFGDDSTINVNAVTEIGGGLEGYGNYRTDLGFGDFRIGEVPDAVEFGQLASDIGGQEISSDIGQEDFGLSYTGSFSGFTFGVNWSPTGSSDRVSVGAKFDIAGFGVGVGFSDDNDGGEDRTEFAVGATFAIAGFNVGVAFKDFDSQEDTDTGLFGDRQTISATAGYGIGEWSFGGTFEGDVGDTNDGDTTFRLDAGYNIASSLNLSGRIQFFTDDDNDDDDLFNYRLLLTKSF